MNLKTRKLTVMAMFVAISVVLVYLIRIPLFKEYLEYDPADIPILIGAFAYGPVAGVVLTVTASVIQGVTVSLQSGPYGIIMHIIATATLVLVASGIYRVKRTRAGAIVGLICGTLAMSGIMLVANHFITPLFTGNPVEIVDLTLLPAILPFNLIKAGVNSIIAFLVYQRVSQYIAHAEPMEKKLDGVTRDSEVYGK